MTSPIRCLLPDAGIRRRGDRDAGARHRRQYRHLHRRELCVAASASSRTPRLAMIPADNGARLAAYVNDWRAESRTLQDVAGWYDARMNLTAARRRSNFGSIASRRTSSTSWSPSAGRSFKPATDLDHADQIVLSDGLADAPRRKPRGARTRARRPVLYGGRRHAAGAEAENQQPQRSPGGGLDSFALSWSNRVGMGGNLNVIVRLAPGATFDDARAELSLISTRIEQAYPSTAAAGTRRAPATRRRSTCASRCWCCLAPSGCCC